MAIDFPVSPAVDQIYSEGGKSWKWNGLGWQLEVGVVTGPPGEDGLSAYEIAVKDGFVGTEEEWLASLVGPVGAKGDTGAQGPAGVKGDTGAQGPAGPKGDTGAQGPAGVKGDTGAQGPIGLTGPAGPAGPKGDTGAQGPAGVKGDTGAQGPAGAVGPAGPTGATGPAGPTAVSANAGNTTRLGTDGLVYTPPFEETDLGELVVLVTHDLTLYVATNGNDTTGDGTQALPWATPHRAMAFLSKCVFGNGVQVTVSVADGTYNFTQPLNLDHPQGYAITMGGRYSSATRPERSELNGGGARGNTAATESFNRAKLEAYYSVIWNFQGCNGLTCANGGGVKIIYLLIRGDGTLFNGITTTGNGFVDVSRNIAIHNFGGEGISATYNSVVVADGITVTNSNQNGFRLIDGGQIQARASTISNNRLIGVSATNNSRAVCSSAIIANNGNRGAQIVYASSFIANQVSVINNGSAGVALQYNSSARLDGCIIGENAGDGIWLSSGGSAISTGSTISNNTRHGVNLDNGGTINVSSSTIENNSNAPLRVINAGNIQAPSVTYTGVPSPALNTIGNGNGYISTT